MTTLNALKKLAAAIIKESSVEDIPGTTIPEVIDYIAENYSKTVATAPKNGVKNNDRSRTVK